MKDITPIVRNGTPPGERPGLLRALTPPMIATNASPAATVSAATLSHGAEDDGEPASDNVDR